LCLDVVYKLHATYVVALGFEERLLPTEYPKVIIFKGLLKRVT